jgi:hypothetical protein
MIVRILRVAMSLSFRKTLHLFTTDGLKRINPACGETALLEGRERSAKIDISLTSRRALVTVFQNIRQGGSPASSAPAIRRFRDSHEMKWRSSHKRQTIP